MIREISSITKYTVGMYLTEDLPRLSKIKWTALSILLTLFILYSKNGNLFDFISFLNLPISVLVGFSFMALFKFYFDYDDKLINNKIDSDIHKLISNVVIIGFFTMVLGIFAVGTESMIFGYVCVFLFSHFITVFLIMFQYISIFAGQNSI